MITPRAFHLIIKHFDAIDRAVSIKTVRKRPWSEVALTSLLCDLMDEETQHEERLIYTIDQLSNELNSLSDSLNFTFSVETHEYDSQMERWVTQSDIGLIIHYNDHFIPSNSFNNAWLLQAKRIYPSNRSPLEYKDISRFESYNKDQAKRLQHLHDLFKINFIKYLLYCPRPSSLDALTRQKLAHLRTNRLYHHIFDYTCGLEIKDEISKQDSRLSAGLFTSSIGSPPKTLADVHDFIFDQTMPFSWFIALNILGHDACSVNRRFSTNGIIDHDNNSQEKDKMIVNSLIRGDQESIRYISEKLDYPLGREFQILPRHTITIKAEAGANWDHDLRKIRR